MKKTTMLLIYCLIFQMVYPQDSTTNSKKIETSISDYFKIDRENIHVHFNKDVYFLEEQIWLKGYIYNQQNKKLFQETTNVFVEIFDSSQNLVQRKLLFANNGIFQNQIKLDEQLNSGNYYFRFYTNYMNNFAEDLSSTYKIKIVNTANDVTSLTTLTDKSTVNIAIFPESGTFLSGIQNSMSVKVTDCFGNGLEVKNAMVLDSDNKEMITFFTNKYGYGKFELVANSNQEYTVQIEVEGNTFSSKLPKSVFSGAQLSVNNFAYPDKTQVKITGQNIDIKKEYYLVINQSDKSIINLVKFDKKQQKTFLIDNFMLFDGVNTARLVDKDLNLLAERLFFIRNNSENVDITASTNNTAKKPLALKGESKLNLANLSMSVLPGKNKSSTSSRNLFNSLLINPYTAENSNYDLDYFMGNSKAQGFDIDLFFMHQQSKTKWTDIQLGNFPASHYSFDTGISLKGKINQEIKDQKDFTIHLFSLEANLNEFTAINDQNEFEFKNLILADSTSVSFQMLDRNRKPVQLNSTIRLVDNDKQFNKPLVVTKTDYCKAQIKKETNERDDFPMFKDAIPLEAVDVKAKPKARQEELKNAIKGENMMLKGIRGSDLPFFQDLMLIDFLKSKNFGVVNINGEDKVTSSQGYFDGYIKSEEEKYHFFEGQKIEKTVSGSMTSSARFPMIMIDNVEQMTHEFLLALRMNQVDEIYYDRRMAIGMAGSAKGYEGMIKVYTKIPDRSPVKNHTIAFQVKQGFSKNYDFENDGYASLDQGFENYGVLQWISNMTTNTEGVFEVNSPLFNQKSVEVFTEGISLDGELISIKKTVHID